MKREIYSWAQLKKLATDKNALTLFRYKKMGKRYEVSLHYDGMENIRAIFNETSRDGVDFTTNFKPLIVESKQIDSDGNSPVSIRPASGSTKNFYSHNLCDKTSWHTESLYVSNEIMTTIDGITWSSINANWIDITHGKVYREDEVVAIRNPALPQLSPVVEIFVSGVWVVKTENSWGFFDNDYTVNYKLGTINFSIGIGAAAQIRVSYHHADKMIYYITPSAGKTLKIIYAEIQHTLPLHFNQSISFQTQVYDMLNLPNRANYGAPVTYKTIRDFEQEARGSYAVKGPRGGTWVSAEFTGLTGLSDALNQGYLEVSSRFDGANTIYTMKKMVGDRGFNSPQLTIPLPYNAYKPINSAFGTRIKITMDSPTNDAMGGEFANVTFYCISEDS